MSFTLFAAIINFFPFYWLSPFDYCLLPIAYCPLPIVYCFLHIVYCLLPIAYCLLPIAYCPLHILFGHHFLYHSRNFLSIRFTEIIAIAAIGWPVGFCSNSSWCHVKIPVASLLFHYFIKHVCCSPTRYIFVNKNNAICFL